MKQTNGAYFRPITRRFSVTAFFKNIALVAGEQQYLLNHVKRSVNENDVTVGGEYSHSFAEIPLRIQ